MIRREFIKSAALGSAGIVSVFGQSPSRPQVAVTMDDFNLFGESESVASKRNRAILDALRRHSDIKATIFVSCANVDNPLGRKLLGEWNDAGHIIGNHTYSHQKYTRSDFDEYGKDILRCDALLKNYSQFQKYFRFPTLHEGDTTEQRDRMRAFLKQHGYRMGYVTIDNSDWYIDTRLRAKVTKSPAADTLAYRDYYLNHIWDRTTYYDKLAHDVLQRQVRHTLLIHHNLLNAMYLSDLLDLYEKRGWKLINAEVAFADPVFQELPKVVPAGQSIIWAIAKEKGKLPKELRFPAEDGEYIKAEMERLGL